MCRTEPIRSVYDLAQRAAQSTCSILILGESGVGKEVLADYIHRVSPRATNPFLKLNCAALPEALFESELFGAERGAFTGALASKPGLLETAVDGTVFLDEIGELALSSQAKLLRVLEERSVMRVGGRQSRPINVRIIAATNRDLDARVQQGLFRADLYYRLASVELLIPPLRERVADIVPLAKLFISQARLDMGIPHEVDVSEETALKLEAYAWPGNARQLRNVVFRALILDRDTRELLVPDLNGRVCSGESSPASATSILATIPPPPLASETSETVSLREELRRVERQRIADALEHCAGNQSRAAALLGMSRRTFVSRLIAYDLPRPRQRSR